MKVEPGKKITMDYELAVEGGAVLESSAERGPVEYVHGEGKMLPALETRIEGMEVGDEKSGVLPAGEIYTPESLPTNVISIKDFPDGERPEQGKQYSAKNAEGQPESFEVISIDGDKVTVRFRGKDLNFKVKILDIAEVE